MTYPQLRNIEHNYRKCEDQLHEIIAERLKQEPALTWHDIVTALRADSVREYSVASEIEHKYIHCQPPPASVPPQVSTESSVSLATSLLTSAQFSLPAQSISQCPTSPLANRESSLSVNTYLLHPPASVPPSDTLLRIPFSHLPLQTSLHLQAMSSLSSASAPATSTHSTHSECAEISNPLSKLPHQSPLHSQSISPQWSLPSASSSTDSTQCDTQTKICIPFSRLPIPSAQHFLSQCRLASTSDVPNSSSLTNTGYDTRFKISIPFSKLPLHSCQHFQSIVPLSHAATSSHNNASTESESNCLTEISIPFSQLPPRSSLHFQSLISQCPQPSASNYTPTDASTHSGPDTHALLYEWCMDSHIGLINRHSEMLTDAISGELTYFSNKFLEVGFVTRRAIDDICAKLGISNREKSRQLLGLLITNCSLARDRKKWFDKFVSLFSHEAAYKELFCRLTEASSRIKGTAEILSSLRPDHDSTPRKKMKVGGQWNSQLHMSHRSQRENGSSCGPPPAIRNNPVPTSHQSHSGSTMTTAVKSLIDHFVDYVKTIYRGSEVERQTKVVKWPPTPSMIFINLACIDRRSVGCNEYEEITKAMVQDGNVDVINARKGPIDFHEIATGITIHCDKNEDSTATGKKQEEKRVILVEGAPGVGKSTFAWEFCRRWERGEIAQQYQVVLLLRLRDDRMSRAKDLNDLLYHPLKGVSEAVSKELIISGDFHALIILEGYDELPDSCRHDGSIFFQLISGKLLPLATVLVTSRPWATKNMRLFYGNRIYQHIEILGFTSHQITEYIESTLPQDKVSDLSLYLEKHPQIRGCMYIPLNSAIVVTVYQESQDGKCALPTTLTELYTALAQTLLLRYLCGHPECGTGTKPMKTFKDLPPAVYTKFTELCRLAYSGIAGTSDRVQLIFRDLPSDFDNLGLMDSVTELYVTQGTVSSHNFLHLTFQEFFAAVHISTMSPAEQLEHFQRHKEGRLRVVLRFLAGITELSNVTHKQLQGLLGEPDVKQNDEQQTLHCKPMRPDVCIEAHHTNWLFEAQNTDLLQSILHNHATSFTFTKAMLPLEYYSVGYCIAHSHSKWSLTFKEDIEEEKLHMLVSGAETGDNECKVALKTISMTSEKLNVLLNGFTSCVEELHYLRIPDNGRSLSFPLLPALHILELGMFNIISAFNVSCDFPFQSLESLTIISSNIISSNKASNRRTSVTLGVKTCKAIGKFLSSSTSLKELRLHSIRYDRKWRVKDKGIEAITKGMSDNIALPLESLEMNCMSTFTTTATRSLAQFITRSTTLQYLKLCFAKIEDVDTFTKGMSDNTALPLKSLEIDCKCTFTTTATCSLAQFITRSTTLQYLRLCSVTFSAQDLVELTEALHYSSSLQEKKLEELLFHVERSEDVASLKHMFNDHPDMQDSIDWNNIPITKNNVMEASVISLALEHSCVRYLEWCNDTISDAGAVALAQALHHNSTLKELGLSNNSISDAGAVALAQALHHNSTLLWLDLYNNSISDAGAVALAQALHHNSTLKELDLFNNSISDAGAVALAQALHHNSTLKELNLSGNDAIGEEGTCQLVQSLTVNTSIVRHGLRLPKKCTEYATQCREYDTVKDRIQL